MMVLLWREEWKITRRIRALKYTSRPRSVMSLTFVGARKDRCVRQCLKAACHPHRGVWVSDHVFQTCSRRMGHPMHGAAVNDFSGNSTNEDATCTMGYHVKISKLHTRQHLPKLLKHLSARWQCRAGTSSGLLRICDISSCQSLHPV